MSTPETPPPHPFVIGLQRVATGASVLAFVLLLIVLIERGQP